MKILSLVAFISVAAHVLTPVKRFGEANGMMVFVKMSGSPFSKKKVIALYYNSGR